MRMYPKKQKEKLYLWKVWGNDLPMILVPAADMDEACRIARRVNEKYNSFQVFDKKVDGKLLRR